MSGKSLGIRCVCGGKTKVINSRGADGKIIRRRHCLRCNQNRLRFNTVEHREDVDETQYFVDVRTLRGGRSRIETFEVTPESGLMVAVRDSEIVATAIETPARKAS